MKNRLLYLFLFVSTLSYAQVGIGTDEPKAFFNVAEGKDVLFGQGLSGAGSKLIWYPLKSAFRVGKVDASQWNLDQTGDYSFASGYNSMASGLNSVAVGNSTTASGYAAMALGSGTTASGRASLSAGLSTKANGDYSLAMGFLSTASGDFALAVGDQNTASGNFAVALGGNSKASGSYALAANSLSTASGNNAVAMGFASTASEINTIAIGSNNTANGPSATAIGNSNTASAMNATAFGSYNTASGPNSTAMGSAVSTNKQLGSFIIGDAGSRAYESSASNQMMMRFSGGYVLYSSGSPDQTSAVGIQLPAGGNAWTTISDSTRKENYRLANGADFLKKIATMRLGSWNYKGQDAQLYRHYGPMAQDFFAAFGHDAVGTIGENKSINQADFDGVNLIAIQALIKEVNQLKAELSAAKEREHTTQARLDKIEALLQDHASQATLIQKP